MNYQRIYDQIIDQAKKESRRKGQGSYYEAHHIIPKCLGGINSKDNMILLTAREHFICHKLLVEIHPNNYRIVFAFWCMCGMRNNLTKGKRYIPSTRDYEQTRLLMSQLTTGIPKSEEHIRKMSESKKGKSSWSKGKKFTDDHVRNNKLSQKNRREVNQLTLEGEFVKTWDSISDAVRQYGIGISHCLMGKQKSTKGYKWQYTTPEPPMQRIGGKLKK